MRRAASDIATDEATPADVPAIVRMAAALSRNERDPDTHFGEAEATRDLFGERRWIRGEVARKAGEPAGMALWHPSYETAWAARGAFLVSLWVEERFRRRGVATALVAAIARRVRAMDGEYLWWASKPLNKRAHATYAALGAASEQVFAHALIGERFLAEAPPARDGSAGILYQVVGYEEHMPEVYAAADLFVGRAGASTIAELATVGVPSILVPWAGAAEDHQTDNAQTLAAAGAALVIPEAELTVERLRTEIDALAGDRRSLDRMAAAAGAAGEIHRSGALVRLVEEIAAR